MRVVVGSVRAAMETMAVVVMVAEMTAESRRWFREIQERGAGACEMAGGCELCASVVDA